MSVKCPSAPRRSEARSGLLQRLTAEELDWIIADENLKPEATHAFVDKGSARARSRRRDRRSPRSCRPFRFSSTNDHATKTQTVLDMLAAFFDRFFGLT